MAEAASPLAMKHRTHSTLLNPLRHTPGHRALLTLAASLLLLSCGGEDGDEGPTGEANCRISEVPAEPSFRAHILPTFQGACTFSSSCHGSKTRSQVDLYLGEKLPRTPADDMSSAEISEMLAGVIGRASVTAPDVQLIAAGSAADSFLMHKVDDTHRGRGYACTPQQSGLDHPCGESMPQTAEELLCGKERETLRRWIDQGAKDN